MNVQLLNRALGTAGPEALQRDELSRKLRAIQAAPGVRFDGRDERIPFTQGQESDTTADLRAHHAGVNCIAIDRFDGR